MLLSAQHLSKNYGMKTLLDDVDIYLSPGEKIGVIGVNGTGKSTLLRCIALLEMPTEGKIEVEGVDISKLQGKELTRLRKSIGVIFQGYNLLMQRNVLHNVCFPLELDGMKKAEREKRAMELLEIVGLADKAKAYPSQLSGGQKQRVAIARALANNPKILLCDEPTSALDSFTTKSILNLLQDINCKLGVTIIIITHEIGVVNAICNKVAIINHGTFVEQGDVSTVMVTPASPVTRMLLGMKEE